MSFIGDCLGTIFDAVRDEAILSGVAVTKDQIARIRFNDDLPRNAHIRYAIADSHVRALRRLLEQFEATLHRQTERPDSDSARAADIEHGKEFCRAARKVIHRNSAIYLDPTAVAATFSEEQANDVFDTLMGASFLDEREKTEDRWVRDAAWARLLASIHYAEADMPPLFRTMFESSSGGYISNFAHCFRDRLKDPRNTEVFQITTALSLSQIKELLDARWASVDDALEHQRATLDHLRARLKLGGSSAMVLSRPRLERRENPHSPASAFRYDRALDDLVGREAELFAMESGFLAPPDPGDRAGMFRWHVLCGDAGAGKSRFAMELLSRVEDYWPLGGFLDAASATTDHSWLGELDRPAFIIVDYAGGRAGVDGLLRALSSAARMGELPVPVRVLLLERRKDDPIFTQLFGIEAILDTGLSSKEQIVEIKQLDDAAILQLMRARLGEHSPKFSDAQLLDHLVDFDSRKRPLFAAIVAVFLKTESLPKIDRDASAEQARWKLFAALIRTWRERIWTAGGHGEIAPYERLAALATFVKGLTSRDHQQLIGRDATLPPPGVDRTSESLRRILGPMLTIENDRGNFLYPAMEPDLAGECFVLGQWIEPGTSELKPLADFHAEAMAELAWHQSPWKAADFARRCYQSYPTTAQAIGYLVPAQVAPEALLPKSMAIASIIAEYVTRYRAKVEAQSESRTEAPTIAEQQEIMALYAMFDPAIHASAEVDVAIARTLAASTRQVINFLARAISDKVRWVDDTVAQKLSDIADGRLAEQQSASRSAFNTGATGDKRVLH
jgi:hypothetical protein